MRLFLLLPALLSIFGSSSPAQDVRHQQIDFRVQAGTRLTFDVSPDGSWLVIDLLGQLWRVPVAGGEAVPLTDAVKDTASDQDPSVSPDGASILFRRDDIDDGPLYLLSVGTQRVRPLPQDPWTNPGTGLLQPAWRPGTKQFVAARFVSVAGRRTPQLTLVDSETGNSQPVSAEGLPPGLPRQPAWSPRGDRLGVVVGSGDIYEIDLASGRATALVINRPSVRTLAWSPNDSILALDAPDSDGRHQIWVFRRGESRPRALTAYAEMQPASHRAGIRWTPDGRGILHVREGKLWSVPVTGGPPVEIPFTARVQLTRRTAVLPPAPFAMPGDTVRARGFTGLAPSPDGRQIALIALDSLWIFQPGARPRALTGLPQGAMGLSWAPDGAALAFSAGDPGDRDLYVASTSGAAPYQVTGFPGEERGPVWSPDGKWIAFVHVEATATGTRRTLRLVSAEPRNHLTTTETRSLGTLGAQWAGQSNALDLQLQWSPDGSALLAPTPNANGSAQLVGIDSSRRQVWLPPKATFVRWVGVDSLVFIRDNRLFLSRFPVDSGSEVATREVVSGAALYPAVSRSGTILYLSDRGLALVRHGVREDIGWPLTFRVPAAPSLVIRNVRLIRGSEASPPSDVLLRNGRISEISPRGSLRMPASTAEIDAGGRYAIPGLIDLHYHAALDGGERRGRLFNGVTVVRELGSPIAPTAAVRDAVAAGGLAGPDLVIGGFQYVPGCSATFCLTSEEVQQIADDASATRALALSQTLGAGVAKLYRPFTLRAGTRFIALAHSAGLRVTGHWAVSLPFVGAGMDSKEHVGGGGARTEAPLYEDVARLAAAAAMWHVPTLSVFRWFTDATSDSTLKDDPAFSPFQSTVTRSDLRSPNNPYYNKANYEAWSQLSAQIRESTSRLAAAGAPIAAGTDLYVPWGIHLELEEMVRSGLSSAAALASATSGAARMLGVEHSTGSLDVGKRADIVLLDGNPLEDIRNARRIWRVIQAGRVVNREALLRP